MHCDIQTINISIALPSLAVSQSKHETQPLQSALKITELQTGSFKESVKTLKVMDWIHYKLLAEMVPLLASAVMKSI